MFGYNTFKLFSSAGEVLKDKEHLPLLSWNGFTIL